VRMTRVCWVGVSMICFGLILVGSGTAWFNSRSWPSWTTFQYRFHKATGMNQAICQ
jgi:hypothetical protein